MQTFEYLENAFKKYYLNSLDIIRDYVSKCSHSFTISVCELEYGALKKLSEDSSYLESKSISFFPNGIEILVPSENFWDDIKNYIPKSVTKLELPLSFIERDAIFLSSLPNLETLIIGDYDDLEPKYFMEIAENTSVKYVYSMNENVKFFSKSKDFSVLEDPYGYYYYKNTLYRSIEEPNVDELLSSNFSIPIKIYSYNLDICSIEKLYSYIDDRLKKTLIIESKECIYTINFNKEKGNYNLIVRSDKCSYVSKIVDYMSKKKMPIESVLWEMINKNYYAEDISSLEDISKITKLSIIYSDSLQDNYTISFINGNSDYLPASYEDFKGLFDSVKWYRKLITDSNLSPVEKVMFAFDILKTFCYNDDGHSIDDTRSAHRVIETGNIVCAGYSDLLIQILNYLDENIKICEFSLSCYNSDNVYKGEHSRNLVKIDDDKYNIHGIFAIDATWDSDKSNVIKSEIVPGYTSLDLYRYFLVPSCEYEKIFLRDTLPDLFKYYLGNEFKGFAARDTYSKLFGINYNGTALFEQNCMDGNVTDDTLRKYLSVRRPSLEQFTMMLINVRMAEGYTKDEAVKEVERVVKLNKGFSKIEGIEFFKEEKGVSK